MLALCRCAPDSFRKTGRIVLDVLRAGEEEAEDAEGWAFPIKRPPGSQYVIVEYDANSCRIVAAEDPDDNVMVWVRESVQPVDDDDDLT